MHEKTTLKDPEYIPVELVFAGQATIMPLRMKNPGETGIQSNFLNPSCRLMSGLSSKKVRDVPDSGVYGRYLLV